MRSRLTALANATQREFAGGELKRMPRGRAAGALIRSAARGFIHGHRAWMSHRATGSWRLRRRAPNLRRVGSSLIPETHHRARRITHQRRTNDCRPRCRCVLPSCGVHSRRLSPSPRRCCRRRVGFQNFAPFARRRAAVEGRRPPHERAHTDRTPPPTRSFKLLGAPTSLLASSNARVLTCRRLPPTRACSCTALSPRPA